MFIMVATDTRTPQRINIRALKRETYYRRFVTIHKSKSESPCERNVRTELGQIEAQQQTTRDGDRDSHCDVINGIYNENEVQREIYVYPSRL